MTRPTEDVEAGSNGTTANTSTCKETDHLGQDLTPKSSHAEYMDWENDPVNPYNWPLRAKIQQVVMISCAAFTSFVHSIPSESGDILTISLDRLVFQ